MRADSPEERLLRLIKGKHKKKPETKEARPGDKKSFLTKFTKKIFLKSKIFKPSFLKPINAILVVILVISLIYLADILLFTPPKDIDSIIEERMPQSRQTDTIPAEEPIWTNLEDFSSYSGQIKGKNLFSPPFIEDEKEDPSLMLDVSKRFSLVGIIAGAEPQAIIEDKETQKTHYLYKGQSINGVTIEEIGQGKVTLNYKGREIILVL